ncbi:hypothetical protein SLS56_010497 [Neofusicoccum ribis]|uniref:Uncharacterized protein n=1 Tax=Neofusicoccum ribis TaxID=45134 RepID=A0ABR3SEA9_9PEZI
MMATAPEVPVVSASAARDPSFQLFGATAQRQKPVKGFTWDVGYSAEVEHLQRLYYVAKAWERITPEELGGPSGGAVGCSSNPNALQITADTQNVVQALQKCLIRVKGQHGERANEGSQPHASAGVRRFEEAAL